MEDRYSAGLYLSFIFEGKVLIPGSKPVPLSYIRQPPTSLADTHTEPVKIVLWPFLTAGLLLGFYQCCGSRRRIRILWASRIRIRQSEIQIQIFLLSNKIVVLFCDYFMTFYLWKNYVNVPLKIKNQKTKFFVAFLENNLPLTNAMFWLGQGQFTVALEWFQSALALSSGQERQTIFLSTLPPKGQF